MEKLFFDAPLKKDVFDIIFKKETVSTNEDVRKMAEEGAKEGTVVIADSQTGGKGTKGRSFSSPKATGLYMSLLLRPELEITKVLSITCAAGVAVCRAIESISRKKVYIKWVNDIYSEENKKLCGILTEATLGSDNRGVKYAVLGIGINVFEPDGGFDDEIKNIAGAVFEKCEKNESQKKELAFAVLTEFWRFYKSLSKNDFLDEYKKRSCVLGKRIEISKGDEKISALATDISDDLSLIVKYDDGREEKLISGDVSIKKL